MKSEKAREFIDGCINNLTVDMPDHVERRLRLAMTHTAELAEQEAEERMRRKAVEAFDDMWINGGEPDYEYQRKRFIQKLTKK
jgi:hypothetical protein